MTASRAPRTPEQRQAQWTRSMVPGTLAGQVVNAFPIEPGPGRMLASQRAAGGFSGAGGAVLFYRDRFTATAGAQALTLTYLPVSGSIHVYLNGVEQDEATDWTSSGRTVNVQTAMDARASDVIDIRYAYSAAVPTPIGLSLPLGTTWKYKQGLGSTSGPAASGYDDSSWASGISPFIAPVGQTTYTSPRTEVPFPLDLWARTSAVSYGRTINYTAVVDTALSIYVDGSLKASLSSSGGTLTGSFALNSGSHLFACYASGDGAVIDQLNVSFVESS